jgi:hypothetical protein
MKRLLFVFTLIFAVSAVFAADGESISEKLFAPESVPLSLSDFGLNGAGTPDYNLNDNSVQTANLNPGKALLLSAIVPGAGEYYAGSKIKAAAFFAVEVAAWTSVILFYNKGKDKEDEFMEFADANFDEMAYRNKEYSLAQSSVGDSGAYGNSFDDWTMEEWERKIQYLPREGFTHELPTEEDRNSNWSHDQQYYEMIGKYIHQFGFGWGDAFGDDPATHFFDGDSPNSRSYMDMRYDSNKMLDYSAWGYNIALLNHVASALDASFSVRIAKRRANAQLSFRQVPYDGEMAKAAGLTFTW